MAPSIFVLFSGLYLTSSNACLSVFGFKYTCVRCNPLRFGLIRLTTFLCDHLYTRKGKLDLAKAQTCVASIASRMLLRDKLVKVFEEDAGNTFK